MVWQWTTSPRWWKREGRVLRWMDMGRKRRSVRSSAYDLETPILAASLLLALEFAGVNIAGGLKRN